MYQQEEEMMRLAAEISLRESESSDPLGMMTFIIDLILPVGVLKLI